MMEAGVVSDFLNLKPHPQVRPVVPVAAFCRFSSRFTENESENELGFRDWLRTKNLGQCLEGEKGSSEAVGSFLLRKLPVLLLLDHTKQYVKQLAWH